MISRSVVLVLIILLSAVFLAWAWNDFIAMSSAAPDALDSPYVYQSLEFPILLAAVILLQCVFAWIARPPLADATEPSATKTSKDVWQRIWVRLFVSSCWTLILAIFLFVLHVFVMEA